MTKIDLLKYMPFLNQQDTLLAYVIIIAQQQDKWVMVKHKERDTLEMPGGKRKINESIMEAAHRELCEETGATCYTLYPVCVYSVLAYGDTSYGLICFANIEESIALSPDSEISSTFLFEHFPSNLKLTYPQIQPIIFQKLRGVWSLFERIKNYKSIIWDWNGTILDDVDVAVHVINQLLQLYKLSTLTKDKYRSIFRFPVKEYYGDLGFNFALTPFEKIGDQFIEKYNREVKTQAKLFFEIELIISLLEICGIKQSILSAASQWHLDEITDHFSIKHFFQHIHGINNHYADSKLQRGRELLEKVMIAKKQTLLIGDTDHDFEVASKLGIDYLLVTDGHQDFERLSKIPNCNQNQLMTMKVTTKDF